VNQVQKEDLDYRLLETEEMELVLTPLGEQQLVLE
jgi:hypothetical protein